MRWQSETNTQRQARLEREYEIARAAMVEKDKALKEWHRVFAWRPHRTVDGGIKMWLEYVLRRSAGRLDNDLFGRRRYRWEYRPITIL